MSGEALWPDTGAEHRVGAVQAWALPRGGGRGSRHQALRVRLPASAGSLKRAPPVEKGSRCM